MILLVERYQKENILPHNGLFQIPGITDSELHNNLLQQDNRSIGQQDAKDFFICLLQNKQHWPDDRCLFDFNTVTATECTECHYTNRSDNPVENLLILFDIPSHQTTMSDIIHRMLNSYEERQEWRDESGCNKITTGKNFLKIQDIRNVEYLLFGLNRLFNVDGQIEILDSSVPVGGSVSVTDDNNVTAMYCPIAIIHYRGHVTEDGDTQGHYMADVLDVETSVWVRTSDDSTPTLIAASKLSDKGYIYLYKKM